MSGRDGGEKKRLVQSLLQMRAGNIVLIDPRFNRFQPEKIDTIRLRAAQIEAGKKPITEKLLKQVKKTRKKGRKTKVLRGETARNIREQRRFERGERRERPEDEPRIVGEPRGHGLAYDPDIERRRLDIQEAQLRDANLRALADRRAQAVAQERELAVRRGELAAGRAERALERQRIAALPAPVAPVINVPAAPAPNIRVEAPQIDLGGVQVQAPPPAQVRVEAPRVDVAPVINIPELPARADADPIPEIQRLGAQLRADVDAYGAEERQRNEALLAELRRNQEQAAAEQAAFLLEQQGVNQAQRERMAAQDAQFAEVQERIGLHEVEIGRARDAVIAEINAAEQRLREGVEELDRPDNYDDVILRAVDERVRQGLDDLEARRVPIEEVEEATPTPRPAGTQPEPERVEAEPEEPSGIEGVIVGGGELDLPNVVVERPRQIEPDEPLRLSPQDPGDRPGAVVEGINPETGRPFTIQRRPGTAGPTGRRAGGGGPLRAQRPVEELQQELEQLAGRSPRLQAQLQATQAAQEEPVSPPARPPTPEQRLEQEDLPPVDPVNVADQLRASRLEEVLPNQLPLSGAALRAQERLEAGQELPGDQGRVERALRLVDSQDFLAGFDRPEELSPAERLEELLSPTGRRRVAERQATAERLEGLLAEQPPTPSPTPRARTPQRDTPPGPGQLAVAGIIEAGEQTPRTPRTPRQRVQAQLRREAEPEGDEPRPGIDVQPLQPVAQGIEQFGGGAPREAPARVIEDAGLVQQPVEPQRELRELDPDVLLEPVEEAEEVGVVQDNRPQVVRDSVGLFNEVLPDIAGNVRTGPQGPRGQRGGIGYRVRNNTDRTLKKVQPGDVVNISGVDAGVRGEGRFRLDTETQTGTRVSLDQLGPLVDDGSFLFERGHRHELGGHFDQNPYGPPPAEPGLLQQGAEAVGGAVAGVAGAGARGLAGVAQGVGEGLVAQLPAAGDVGAALGRGAVAGIVGAGRLAAGAAGAVGEAVLGGGEEEEEEDEP